MAVGYETELYEPVKSFFEKQGYHIKAEVRYCDLVGVKEGMTEPLIVEIKKSFNLSLLLQGMQRLKTSNNVYLAVERNRVKRGAVNQRFGEITDLCQKLGLGLITVTIYKTKPALVDILCEPQQQMKSKKSIRKQKLLREFEGRSGDYNLGGSHQKKLVTAYRERALKIAYALEPLPFSSPAQLARATGISTTAAILQNNYYGWFERIERGRYTLTTAGREALTTYNNVLQQNIPDQTNYFIAEEVDTDDYSAK
ncbi:DUF2161 family putative PD-(D/E)XK-type phosphodiesterase [Paenibacillus sp. Marseille-Q4541]|uniref:DUF2161 domain-containing phosphodiesterase n=1 Tax=Paenibacillus sp. Marseille-Q4541 TaxID=2831522 RepID=UPI001BA796EA|nr:DUF2161 family putative PD-(D/E)XK-type phosphodiesterase [Paenibacillus sp. Marseille-Q4541]